MVNMSPKTRSLLDEVERYKGRSFALRNDVGLLVEFAASQSRQYLLNDITFTAKFVSNAMNILRRTGSGNEQTAKLENELGNNLKRVTDLMLELTAQGPSPEVEDFRARYLSPGTARSAELMRLLSELSWLKDYALERRESAG